MSGIIDFSDASVGGALVEYSALDGHLLEPVASKNGVGDKESLEQIQFLAKRFSLFWLHASVTGGPATKAEALGEFRRMFSNEL